MVFLNADYMIHLSKLVSCLAKKHERGVICEFDTDSSSNCTLRSPRSFNWSCISLNYETPLGTKVVLSARLLGWKIPVICIL